MKQLIGITISIAVVTLLAMTFCAQTPAGEGLVRDDRPIAWWKFAQ